MASNNAAWALAEKCEIKWDTGGQQRYRPILASCYRGALGVIIVFDVTNRMSFTNIKQWIDEVDEFATESNLPRILVGS